MKQNSIVTLIRERVSAIGEHTTTPSTAHRQTKLAPPAVSAVCGFLLWTLMKSHELWHVVPIFMQFLLDNPLKLQPKAPEAVCDKKAVKTLTYAVSPVNLKTYFHLI